MSAVLFRAENETLTQFPYLYNVQRITFDFLGVFLLSGTFWHKFKSFYYLPLSDLLQNGIANIANPFI